MSKYYSLCNTSSETCILYTFFSLLRHRLATVLARLKDVTDTADDYSRDVFRIKVKLQKAQKVKRLCRLNMTFEVDDSASISNVRTLMPNKCAALACDLYVNVMLIIKDITIGMYIKTSGVPLCLLLQKLSQLQTAVDTERAVCEQTHQQCLLEDSCLSHLQEQLDLAEHQAQEDLPEVRLFLHACGK